MQYIYLQTQPVITNVQNIVSTVFGQSLNQYVCI